jgi:hypothetical protein
VDGMKAISHLPKSSEISCVTSLKKSSMSSLVEGKGPYKTPDSDT